MLKSYSLFKTDGEISPASTESNHDLNVVETLWAHSAQEKSDTLYSQLVYKVQRDPKHLISHVQRIYYTYSHNMRDPLYAAFVDLFLALDGGGKDLSTRLLTQTLPVLSKQQSQIITTHLKTNSTAPLIGNKYTVLTNGVLKPPRLPAKAEEVFY